MIEFADRAVSVVGYTAGDGRYEGLVAKGETSNTVRALDVASGCALVIRGLLRQHLEELDITPPAQLCAPYHFGQALTILLGLAHRAGAEFPASTTPELGDIVWLASPEHVEVFVGDGFAVAGGERDYAGNEMIRCVTRSGTTLADAPAVPAISLPPRQVLRIVRASALLAYLEGGGA